MPAGAPTAAAAAKGPAYGRACGKEGKVSRRVEACRWWHPRQCLRATSGYDGTHDALTGGGSSSMNVGDGHSQGGRSDGDSVEAEGWRSSHGEDASQSRSRPEQKIRVERAETMLSARIWARMTLLGQIWAKTALLGRTWAGPGLIQCS
jgi:hypothetical protein